MLDTPHAVCCWCQRGLVKSAGTGTWWCPTDACQQRQLRWSVRFEDKKQHTTEYFSVPLPKQVAYREQPTRVRYRGYGGAAGPGKSKEGRDGLYWHCLAIPQLECLLVRNTFKQLETTHLRRMEADTARLQQRGIGVEYLKTEKLMKFPNGSLIQAGHMEEASDVENYLSTEYDIIVADEGSQFPVDADGHAVIISLSTRARSTKPQVLASHLGRGQFWLLTNPGGPSWQAILDFFVDKQPDLDKYPQLKDEYDPEEWGFMLALLDDNPYLPPEYAKDLAVLPKWRYEQLRYGNLRVFAGQFFSEFNERVHVRTLAA